MFLTKKTVLLSPLLCQFAVWYSSQVKLKARGVMYSFMTVQGSDYVLTDESIIILVD